MCYDRNPSPMGLKQRSNREKPIKGPNIEGLNSSLCLVTGERRWSNLLYSCIHGQKPIINPEINLICKNQESNIRSYT